MKPVATSRRSRRADRGSRGVALILVLTTLAILTAIGVDFSYGARVDLRLAENLRDETRAHFLARSAVNLSRLLLHFQKQLDGLGGQLSGALDSIKNNLPGPNGAPRTPMAPLPNAQPGQSKSLGIRL